MEHTSETLLHPKDIAIVAVLAFTGYVLASQGTPHKLSHGALSHATRATVTGPQHPGPTAAPNQEKGR